MDSEIAASCSVEQRFANRTDTTTSTSQAIEAPAKPGGAYLDFHLHKQFFGIFGTVRKTNVRAPLETRKLHGFH
jgi:hypothetical protein